MEELVDKFYSVVRKDQSNGGRQQKGPLLDCEKPDKVSKINMGVGGNIKKHKLV